MFCFRVYENWLWNWLQCKGAPAKILPRAPNYSGPALYTGPHLCSYRGLCCSPIGAWSGLLAAHRPRVSAGESKVSDMIKKHSSLKHINYPRWVVSTRPFCWSRIVRWWETYLGGEACMGFSLVWLVIHTSLLLPLSSPPAGAIKSPWSTWWPRYGIWNVVRSARFYWYCRSDATVGRTSIWHTADFAGFPTYEAYKSVIFITGTLQLWEMESKTKIQKITLYDF